MLTCSGGGGQSTRPLCHCFLGEVNPRNNETDVRMKTLSMEGKVDGLLRCASMDACGDKTMAEETEEQCT